MYLVEKHRSKSTTQQLSWFGPGQRNDTLMVSALFHEEYLSMGRLIATVTGGLNLWLSGDRIIARRVGQFNPPEPIIFRELIQKLLEMNITTEAIILIQRFYTRLSFAKCALGSILIDGTIDSELSLEEIECVADTWRSLCGQAIGVIHLSEGFIMAHQDKEPLADFREDNEVLMMLAAARDGAHPNIESGSLTVPGWAERRRYDRHLVDISAVLELEGGILKTRIVNISRSGLNIETSKELSVNQKVTVILADGRRLPGTVRWVEGVQAGMALEALLESNDPLLDQ